MAWSTHQRRRHLTGVSFFFVITLLFTTCFSNSGTSSNGKPILKITGKAWEILVVCPENLWKGELGQMLRDSLQKNIPFLPQPEKDFSLRFLPPASFSGFLSRHRNILQFRIETTVREEGIRYKKDVHAWPQEIVTVEARNIASAHKLLARNLKKIRKHFYFRDISRIVKAKQGAINEEAKEAISLMTGARIIIPSSYILEKKNEECLWVRREKAGVSSLNILIYTSPYDKEDNISWQQLVDKRNEITKKNIRGTADDAYMAIEMQFPPKITQFKISGKTAIKMEGLWYMKNDFMGGPFRSISLIDTSRNLIITADGFVFAPSKKKRPLIRELEAILYSLALH